MEEETVSIESLKEETEEKTPQRKSHWGKAVIICIAALILLLGSYVAGFYQLIPLEELFRPAVAPIEETQTAPEPAPVVQMSDTLIAAQPDTLAVPITEPQPPADPMAAAQEAAKQYPQVRGGKYLIVGTKSVHVMTRTDNLYKLARTTYGSNAMVQYIIVYNQFKDPDVIPPGYEIKLPELVEKK